MTISKDELEIEVNGKSASILNIQKIKEYARDFFIYGYIVQIEKPKQDEPNNMDYDKITIILKSSETGEMGKGEAFIKLKK